MTTATAVDDRAQLTHLQRNHLIDRLMQERVRAARVSLDSVPGAVANETLAIRDEIERTLWQLVVDADVYGTCTRCGATIPFLRLDLMPWAAHCRDCEQALEARIAWSAAGAPTTPWLFAQERRTT